MKHKVLIVEDDIDDQLLFTETIHDIDPSYECACVGNGAEAISYLENTVTLPSIILLDLNMPLMNGFDFLETIKKMENFRNLPVVIFSTSSAIQDMQRTKRLGATSFFTKSNHIKEMRINLIKVLF